jgi:serine/threonine protein kinase
MAPETKSSSATSTAGAPATSTDTATATAGGAELVARSTIPRTLGPVTLVREIGRGGMGTVWLGRHELLGRDVAVKFLLTDAFDRADPRFVEFMAGARAACAVRHLGLTAVLHADLHEGLPYLVMEYVDGPSLSQVMRATGPMPPADAVAVMRGIVDAVAELHEHDIVHRDIKPANVLVDADGHTFVTDFGLACLRGAGGARVAGTPAYMAPELWSGEVSPRTDVFALGVMAYELVAGRVPFAGDAEAVRRAYGVELLPTEALRAAGAGEQLIDVIERALHWDPIYRYKTARHLARALQELAGAPANATSMLMKRVARTRGAAPAEPAVDPDGSSERYYGELSNLAERKRQKDSSGGAVAEHATTAAQISPPPPQPTTVEVGGRLRHSWSCIGCEYDLRWAHRDGRCPECGRPVADTVAPDLFVFANLQWLRGVRHGLLLCHLGLAFITLTFLAAPALGLVVRDGRSALAIVIAVSAAMLLSLSLVSAGALRIARPQPGLRGEERGAGLRRPLRRVAWAVPVTATAWAAARILGVHPIITTTLLALTALLTYTGLRVLMRYLRTFAERLQDRRLRRQGRDATWVVTIAGPAIVMYSLIPEQIRTPSPVDRRDSTLGAVLLIVMIGVTMLIVFAPSVIGSWVHRLRKGIKKAMADHLEYEDMFDAMAPTPSTAPPGDRVV